MYVNNIKLNAKTLFTPSVDNLQGIFFGVNT